MAQMTLRIFRDGKVMAETHGVKGKACLDYIRILEELTGSVAVDSAFTDDYKALDTNLLDFDHFEAEELEEYV